MARTGYTGEPVCLELFVEKDDTVMLWDLLLERGAQPVGLGARDTLRLEAGLPLYGHELGIDPEEQDIPVFSIALARFAVSFNPLKGDFIGKQALSKQFEALKRIIVEDSSLINDLPQRIKAVAVTGKGIARAGNTVFSGSKQVGYITSGTMVPYWKTEGKGIASYLTEEIGKRAICLALLDSDLREGDEIDIEIRGRKIQALIVPYHLRSEAPPYARAIPYDQLDP